MMKVKLILVFCLLFLSAALVGSVAGKPGLTKTQQNLKVKSAAETNSQSKAEVVPTTPTAEPQAVSIFPEALQSAESNAAGYAVPWKSINGGGGTAQTATHKVSVSIGQATIGYASSPAHSVGLGYWYGVGAADACDCGVWGDVTGEGNIDPNDAMIMAFYVYRNQDARVQLANCPYEAGDVTCDGMISPVDMAFYVFYVFRNMDGFCADPCTGP